jgi:alcohol dehydrogenase class IV
MIFGPGKIILLPSLAGLPGTDVLLVTGRSSFSGSRAEGILLNSFIEKKIRVSRFVIPTEPSPEMIDSAVGEWKGKLPDLVIAIGGGSVIDAGKAISAMLRTEGSVRDYLEGVGKREHNGLKVPFIAVPTTSGTGSEATKNAVLSEVGADGFKRSLRHENFVPDFALVDPELTLSCPPRLTAASGMDCFTQLTEAFLSDKGSVMTDSIAREGIKAVARSLERAYHDGADLEARTDMSFAALASGICLANAGLGLVHGFASSVGAMVNIPHGILCGTLMPAANELTVRKLRKGYDNQEALARYVSLGKIFLGTDDHNDDYYIDGFISYLHYLRKELGLPGLSEYGIGPDSLAEIARQTDCKNNPVKVSAEEMYEILDKSLSD